MRGLRMTWKGRSDFRRKLCSSPLRSSSNTGRRKLIYMGKSRRTSQLAGISNPILIN